MRRRSRRIRRIAVVLAACGITVGALLAVAPLTSAAPAEPGPACVGEETLEVSPGLSALEPSTCRPTADGVVTVRNDFTAVIGASQGTKFSGTYGFVPLEGDCVTAPLTKFKVVFDGYWNDNTRD
ncbi:hypothetical protein [Pseudonocardia sp. T1-2H]|uniref:hypothetical protein n=1 Tax=Pseudonocardia sp. T1-2H TaxID=3128899 RepID=UPI0031010A91